ncbi:DNA repair endonuclease XPF [Phlebotomus argentipes]|uniref:DNA repair endonuclease XPF n=1 Tax=Phlebotomus argentipes TaxID=94469 RepID=UPI002892C215|nr:DNA repair endonuclease XPF [Phlebotomus argentipes]XP_059608926.1 DNA repair endonuclease XPF [Phlebotomus argentipes]
MSTFVEDEAGGSGTATAMARDATKEESEDGALLEYERQMLIDLHHSDGLVICAKGIHYNRVLLGLLRALCDPANLVIVMNCSESEEKYYRGQLNSRHVHESATNAREREKMYLEGGIHFITTRILVVDLLKNRIPIEMITGIFVLRAHMIIESCQEAFALRLYRRRNSEGFVKAFSNSAESFTFGFGHVERVVHNLYVSEMFVWPRFQSLIQTTLKRYEPVTVELHIPMTQKMISIQTNILEIMNFLVKEVKRINPNIDMQEITVENCVTKKFHKILQLQLDTVWHQLSQQSKMLISDLKILRSLMITTIYHDCISLYAALKRYKSSDYVMNSSGWGVLDAADHMFETSKRRVFNADDEFEPEWGAKWRSLSDILCVEIPNDIKLNGELRRNKSAVVLILCQDNKTCYQLNQYLMLGAERCLLHMALKNDVKVMKMSKKYQDMSESKNMMHGMEAIQLSEGAVPTRVELNDPEELQGEVEEEPMNAYQDSYIMTMSVAEEVEGSEDLDVSTQMETGRFSQIPTVDRQKCVTQPIVCIQTFKSNTSDPLSLEATLRSLNPQYVVMFHCNVTAIRQLEVHEARLRRDKEDRIKVFFLLHAETIEEQSYLTNLRREKQAFEHLIETKKTMVIPRRLDEIVEQQMDDEDFGESASRRNAAQESKKERMKVITDMREFRSDLPCLIHKLGIEVIPITITIGDYVLTPEVCVERKSISDLIGSLNSGRLYNQCTQMVRNYAVPILLIEFDQNRPFYLQDRYMISNDTVSNSDIKQKLQLLTLHFPKLRIVWSPTPYATAQLFYEMKQNKPEPDEKLCSVIGSDAHAAETEVLDKFNMEISDFLLRLPGVTEKNVFRLMKSFKDFKELLRASQKELQESLDSGENAKLLWEILHLPQKPKIEVSSGKFPAQSRFRNRKFQKGKQ